MNKKEDMTARGSITRQAFLKEIWTDLHGRRDFLQHETIQKSGHGESPPSRGKEKGNSEEEGTRDGLTCQNEMLGSKLGSLWIRKIKREFID